MPTLSGEHTPFKGNQVTLTWGGENILGVREKGIALNGEPIDISSDDDAGWRKLLALSAQDQVDISLSGVTKSRRFKNDWFKQTRQKTLVITWPNGDSLTGTFMLATYTDTGNYKDAVTFEAALQSSGTALFTPVS